MGSPYCSTFLQTYPTQDSISSPLFIPKFKIYSSDVKTNEKNKISVINPPIITPTLYPQISLNTPPAAVDHSRRRPEFLATIFRLIDNFISDFLDPPLHPSRDPNHVLVGNFAPVGELPPTPCHVIDGVLPPSLNGTYIRNGPNPQFIPHGPYHLFDGDGMLHAITIADGKATFCSRFVKTYKYELEKEIRSPVIINIFSAFNGMLPSLARCAVAVARVAAGQYDPRRGCGVANTGVAMIGGRLFALAESDLPYEVEITPTGDIITVGRQVAFGEPFMTMTAHPKVDFDSGETFAFRHSITAPFLSYFRITSDGVKLPEIGITSLTEASMVHDFALSENYAIFPDIQIVINPAGILQGRPPFTVDLAKVPRLGIIPRYAANDDDMWWIDMPGFNLIHAINAWEEGLAAAGQDGGATIVMVATNIVTVEHALDDLDLTRSSLEKIEIDLNQRKIIGRQPLSDMNLDFATINPAYVGKKNRYVYAGIGDPNIKLSGIVKIDLSLSDGCVVATRMYGGECYGSETYFVATEPNNRAAEEDDGYLISYMHNEKSKESKFVAMDAKSPNLEIVATVKLPRRVPYGFHGIFVRRRH